MTVGDRLRELREQHDLTLEAAGKIADTTKQNASQIEKGVTKAPGGIFLYRWSKHYGVSLEWLITGKGPKIDPSHSQRPDFEKMAAAVQVLWSYLKYVEEPLERVADPVYLEVMHEAVEAFGGAVRPDNVLDITKWAEKRLRGEQGDARSEVQRVGRAVSG